MKYESYKDSGVDWIGKIPIDWRKSKFKFVSDLYTGNSLNETQKLQYESENLDDISYVSSKDIDVEYNTVNYNNGLRIPRDQNPFKISPKGSFLMVVEGGSAGRKMVYLEQEVCFVNKLCSFSSTESTKFQFYFVQSKNFQDKFNLSISGLIGGVSNSKLKDFELPLPPLAEQIKIVSFLDTKTSLINSLINKTQRKIKLLKEKRISLINKVVTKGINSNVDMKDSGVEWIGDIPIHWNLNKVGNNTYVKGRIGWKGLRSEDFIDEGPYLITGTDFKSDGTISWDNIYHVNQERYDEDPFIQLRDHDVLITKDGTIGKVVYVGNLKGQTCLNSGIFLTRPTKEEYIPRYFFWILNSNIFKTFVNYNSGGSTILHLYQNVFVNFKFPIPSIHEQQEIVSFLDKQTGLIDNALSNEKKRIKLLKEYRQSLISHIVTGKIRITKDML